MSTILPGWVEEFWRQPAPRDKRIGPGKLLLVVGPSGAGKDTLIDYARRACRGDDAVTFPRRIVTRPAATSEDHESVDKQEFVRLAQSHQFALWWQAHGLGYGICKSIDDALLQGRTVVCNVSRTVVAPARLRYEHVTAVLVTAARDVLAQRLADRGRESASSIAERLARSEDVEQKLQADVIIDNSGLPEHSARLLVEAIYRKPFPFGF